MKRHESQIGIRAFDCIELCYLPANLASILGDRNLTIFNGGKRVVKHLERSVKLFSWNDQWRLKTQDIAC